MALKPAPIAAAALTGVATSLAGTAVPVIGLVGGLVVQALVEPTQPAFRRYEEWTQGITDGSAALVAFAIIR